MIGQKGKPCYGLKGGQIEQHGKIFRRVASSITFFLSFKFAKIKDTEDCLPLTWSIYDHFFFI